MTTVPLCNHVQQIRFRGSPTASNQQYPKWQTVKIAILIRDEDRHRAIERAEREVARRHLKIIERLTCATIEEEQLRPLGDAIWETYQRAVAGELVFMEEPEQSDFLSPQGQVFAPPLLTEERFDEIIHRAGGKRILDLVPEQDDKNADYLLGRTIWELKSLDEDGLDKKTRQEKLGSLFAPYAVGANCILNPEQFNRDELNRYLDIMSGPITTHVKKASRQIKASRRALGDESLRGGIILLNTGFPALGHRDFADQVARHAGKYSSLESVVAISVWMPTNGFDLIVNTAFDPHEDNGQDVVLLRDAYWAWFDEMMTDLMRGKIPQEEWTATPTESMGFTVEGVTYRWEPERPQDSRG